MAVRSGNGAKEAAEVKDVDVVGLIQPHVGRSGEHRSQLNGTAIGTANVTPATTRQTRAVVLEMRMTGLITRQHVSLLNSVVC